MSRSSSSKRVSSAPLNFTKDPDDVSPITSGFVVYGRTTRVTDACTLPSKNLQGFIKPLFDGVKNYAGVEEIMLYDIVTRKQFARSLRTSVNTFEYKENYDAFTPDEKKALQGFYTRMRMSSYNEFSAAEATFIAHPLCKSQEYTLVMVPAAVMDVQAAGPTTAPLTQANGTPIGSFHFIGDQVDNKNKLQIRAVKFAFTTQGVKLTKIQIGSEGTTERKDCSSTPTEITCASIPFSIGQMNPSRTFTVYADVTKNVNVPGSLQLSIKNFGQKFSPGSVEWSNAYEIYDWMSPTHQEVQGTLFQ